MAGTFNRLVKAVALASSDEGDESDSARHDSAGGAAGAEIGGEQVRVIAGGDLCEADGIEKDGEVCTSGGTFCEVKRAIILCWMREEARYR